MDNRLIRIRSAMAEKGIRALLVSDPRSIYYITGVSVEPGERFFGLLIKENSVPILIVNRLFGAFETDLPIVWYTDTDDLAALLAGLIGDTDRLGVDKMLPARFLIPLSEKLPGCAIVLGSECVDWVRAVKDADEREKMRASSRINDEVMLRTRDYLREGITELEVAEYLSKQYLELGCEGISFEPIVSFGKNAADPHHMPDETRLCRGNCVVIDIGGKKDSYCSDMTRTYAFGECSGELRFVHELVRRANETAESMIRPGVRLCDIDKAARDVISDAGYGEYFTHRLGHFIGMDVHEYGDVSAAFTKPVEEGMCFSCEPGVYLPGNLGVRIEDLVLVTRDGCEILNRVPKTLEIIE